MSDLSAPVTTPAAVRPIVRIRTAAVLGFLAAVVRAVFFGAASAFAPDAPACRGVAFVADVALVAAFFGWTLAGRRAERIVGAVVAGFSLLSFVCMAVFFGGVPSVPLPESFLCAGLLALSLGLLSGVPLLARAGSALGALLLLPALASHFCILSGGLLAGGGDPFFSLPGFGVPFDAALLFLSSLLFCVACIQRGRAGAPTPEETAAYAARAADRAAAREESRRWRREAHERDLRKASETARQAARWAAEFAARQAAAQQAARWAASSPPPPSSSPGAVPTGVAASPPPLPSPSVPARLPRVIPVRPAGQSNGQASFPKPGPS